MRKRINNDFDALVEVLHEGVKIDLSLYEITSVRMVSNQAYQVTDYKIRNGSLFLHITPLIVPKIGRYKIVVTYRMADSTLADGFWNYEFDKYLVTIVGCSGEEDAGEVVITADAVIGMQGKSAYQVWLDAGNAGTVEDYLENIKGDPFLYSDFTPEQLEALKVKGDKGDPFLYSDFTPEQLEALKVKGDKGDAFLYEDFTPEQLEALKVKGDKGDAFLYSDFLPEQMAELQRPATEAVTAVNEAEALRVTAETTRVGNEQGRVTAEGTRQSNEIARENSEDDRDEAEALRLSAEVTRGQNEQGRVTAEGTRQSNETARQDSEDDRDEAEALRLSAEVTRGQNEQARITAEGLRVTAEGTRQTNTATAITNANTAATNANTKAGLANDAATLANTKATLANDAAILANEKAGLADTAATNADNARLAIAGELNNSMKTLRMGAVSGMVTISPTSSYGSYYIEVSANSTIMIDLNRIINQLGACNVSLIINMPVVRTITWLKPVVWNNNTAETFATAGQYVLKIRDIDGSNTPLVTLESKTLKAVATGVVLYVDGSTADYTTAQINGETATRTSNSWATPFRYLQNAINAATAGDVIFVKQGTYYPTHKRNTANNGVDAYVDGDHNNKLANFVMKNSVDIYGGFKGTETAMWQREVDAKGFMKKETILSADKEGNGSNRRYHVVFGSHLSALTYANGLKAIGANTTGDTVYQGGGGFLSFGGGYLVNINCVASGNTGAAGGGFQYGTNNNCIASGNTATKGGGGFFGGTNNNCIASGNTATNGGGGFFGGTNNNCIASGNTATNGGGFQYGTNNNCIASGNTATNGGGFFGGTNNNCIASGNTATNGGGSYSGTNNNCILVANTGGGSYYSLIFNCTAINNKGIYAVLMFAGSAQNTTNINNVLIGNKDNSGATVGFRLGDNTSLICIFKNNAYDNDLSSFTIKNPHPGNDIDFNSCVKNLTLEQAKITLPSFVGAPTTPEQKAELDEYLKNIHIHLKPLQGSILKGKGIKTSETPAMDYSGNIRSLTTPTIGAFE